MGTDQDDFSTKLDQAKRASVGQLLMRCARLFNEQALSRIRERSGVPIRPAHTTLFPHIDLEGTRLTELARRLGVSKQAVGQLVGELERFGMLERVPDPADGRAKLVRFIREGENSIFEGIAVLRELELRLEQEIGARRMQSLHRLLLVLMDALDELPDPAP